MNKISGTGSVFFRESRNRWVTQYNEIVNGKKVQKCLYSLTKEEAYQKLNTIMYEYHNDMYIRENGIPLIRVLKQNREDKFAANLISESHYSRLDFVIKEIENSEIGNMNIDEITTRDLQNYFNSLINRYADSTIKKVWECVKQGFETAIDEKYILENPFRKVLKPKSRKKTKVLEALSPEDEYKLASYLLQSNLKDEKYKVAILIQLYAGLRIGEVLALSKDDIDFESNNIIVRKTVTVDRDGDLTIKEGAKTAAGQREVPINQILKPALLEQVEESNNNLNNYLFLFENRLIKPSSVNTVLKRICKQQKLSRVISNHELRHTFGTRCVESGMAPKVVQSLMGHNDVSVTLNTYTSVQNHYVENEFNKVAQYYMNNTKFLNPEIITTEYKLFEESDPYNIDSSEKIYNGIPESQLIKLFGGKEKYLEVLRIGEIETQKWLEKQIRKQIKESSK